LAISAEEALTRLARVLWNGTPDADLLKRANVLKTREDVRQLALEMLKDPRARLGVGAFYRWWLWLDATAAQSNATLFGGNPDTKRYPEWTMAMSADAAEETETFGVNVTLDLNGSFRTLMTASFTYANERLAKLYGLSGVVGDQLRKVDLDPTQRAGLLTQAAILSRDLGLPGSNPPRRGRIVRELFYCQTIPGIVPSPGLPPTLPDRSNRQRFEMATSGSPCAACHYGKELNMLGFPFEGFDEIGRHRTIDDLGKPLDVTGLKLQGDSGRDLAFDGPIQLAALLADKDAVQRCMGQQWLTFALGLPPKDLDKVNDNGELDDIQAAFKSSGLDLRELIAAVVQSGTFLAPVDSTADGGGGDDAGVTGNGCSAPAIFSKHGCTSFCHTPATAPSVGGLDMVAPGWERNLVGSGPPDTAPGTNLCKSKGLNYLNKTQPATGLLLDKLRPNPPCGMQMPVSPDAFGLLSASELACVQTWANNVVAANR
jgi:hypothetical protein